MDLSFSDLLSPNSPFAPTPSDSSTSPYTPSSHVDLSTVDFEWVASCTSIPALTSVISQLQHEPFPDLLRSAQQRLAQLDPEQRREEARLKQVQEVRANSLDDLLQWVEQTKTKEQRLADRPLHPPTAPVRGSRASPADDGLRLVQAWTADERAARVQSEKLKGNEAYKAQDYPAAVSHYGQALQWLPTPATDWTIHTNLAIAYIRVERYTDALAVCEQAIAGSGGHCVKAWWRKALALEGLGRQREAHSAVEEAHGRAEGRVREEISKDRARIDQAAREQPAPTPAQSTAAHEEKEQLTLPLPTTQPAPPSSLRRIPIEADDSDSDSEAEATDPTPPLPVPTRASPTPSPVRSAPSARPAPFVSRTGMVIEVEEEGTEGGVDVSVPVSYAVLARRLVGMGEEGRVRLMRGMGLNEWRRLVGERCQLSAEVLQAMVSGWQEASARVLEEMEVVGRVERLGLILKMLDANTRVQLQRILDRMQAHTTPTPLNPKRVAAVRGRFLR